MNTKQTDTALVKIALLGGGKSVYEVLHEHLPKPEVPASKEWPRMYGRLIGTQFQGSWYRPTPNGMVRITDASVTQVLDSVREV